MTSDECDSFGLWQQAILKTLRSHKASAEQAVAQLDDAQLHQRPGPTINSVAVLLHHLGGNFLSRWSDFLTTDGEKPSRQRDAEFEDWTGTRGDLLALWQRGWDTMLNSIAALTPADVTRTVTIRGEPHTVPLAIIRSMTHTAYHVGQIRLVARLVRGDEGWQWATIPPGGSVAFNAEMGYEPAKGTL